MNIYWFLTVLIIWAYMYMLGLKPLVGWKREIPIK
jgi:hypothetical protein